MKNQATKYQRGWRPSSIVILMCALTVLLPAVTIFQDSVAFASDPLASDSNRRRKLWLGWNWNLNSILHNNLINRNEDVLCNGHANLCSKPVNEIMFATMHNANNAILDGGVVFPNHVLDLKSALEKGYRGINMDIGKCLDEVTLVHFSCLFKTKTPLEIVLQQLLDFLDDNLNEVLIVPTEIVEGDLVDTPTIAEVEAAFQEVDGWTDKLYDHPGPGVAPWPTLQELIDTDQRILYFFYNAESCTKGVDCPVGFHPYFQYAAETEFSFPFIWSFNNKEEACRITRGGGGTRDFFGVNVFVTPARFISQVIRTNKADFLREHLQACRDVNEGLQPNLVSVDFWKIGDVMAVVDEINAAL